MTSLLLRLERLAAPVAKMSRILVALTLALFVGSYLMIESAFRAAGFIGWTLAIWVGGLAIFANLFSRRGGTLEAPDEPASRVASASRAGRLFCVAFCATWLILLASITAVLISRIAA